MSNRLLLIALLLPAVDIGAAPLFSSDEPLAIRIEAPMRDLVRFRLDHPEYSAIVQYTDSDGSTVRVPATISSRGNSRLDYCEFPPIRLDFGGKATAGTLFEGQGELKLVTQCGRGRGPERWVYQEFGIYRAYNGLTDASFRVRMLDVTYQDDSTTSWTRVAPAFVIEPVEAMAGRLGRVVLRPPEVREEQLDPDETAMSILFQFLIGNTDFAVKRGPSGEGCCHNGRVLAVAGSQDDWIVVPYDFDQAGVINTDYALPDEQFGIRRVTRRVYRGFCMHNDRLPAAIERLNAGRAAITDALAPASLARTWQARATRFVNGFYEIVNDPQELETELLDKCRGAASFAVRKTKSAGP
ncbi:MAG: hypothetical protein OEW59_07950 [Gammaproteobacteria bacterium]|nr:hypothetical protein [Gammaproteobacteria bacterium]